MSRALTLMLALLLAVTSLQVAQARAVMASAAGQVILCTGQGAFTVTLDINGAPMDIVHSCPDCALTLSVDLAAPNAADPSLVHMKTLVQTLVLARLIPIIPKAHPARAPPQTV